MKTMRMLLIFVKNYASRHKVTWKVDKRICPKDFLGRKKVRGFGTNYSCCVPGKKGNRVVHVAKKTANALSAARPVVLAVKAWFASVKKAADTFQPLPPRVIQILQPHYKVDLRNVRWAMSPRFLPLDLPTVMISCSIHPQG